MQKIAGVFSENDLTLVQQLDEHKHRHLLPQKQSASANIEMQPFVPLFEYPRTPPMEVFVN